MYAWNQLSSGLEVDPTREQLYADEHVQEPSVLVRPPVLGRLCETYLALREHIAAQLPDYPPLS